MARDTGLCQDQECASPLDFDSLLVSLFGVTSDGCVGLKVVHNPFLCEDDANLCATNLTLQQLIEKSIVSDGCDGNALQLLETTIDQYCAPICGMSVDIETVLKMLFAINGDCFGIKVANIAIGCTDTDSFVNCTAPYTWEQIIMQTLVGDACSGLILPYMVSTEACTGMECATHLTDDELVETLFKKYETPYCPIGVIQFNTASVLCTALTDLKECGMHLTFLDALKMALVPTVCGYALNVFNVENQVN